MDRLLNDEKINFITQHQKQGSTKFDAKERRQRS